MTDLEARAFKRQGRVLVPADFVAEEWMNDLPEGKEILLSGRTPRRISNHKHLFAILKVACEQLEGYPDVETLLDAIKIATHLTRPVKLASGEIAWIPKSINWGAMPEDQFQRWKDRAMYVLGQLLGVDPQELLEETASRNARVSRSFDMDERPAPPPETYEGEGT